MSPRNDFGQWREEIGGDRFDVEFSGFKDEVSEVLLPTIEVAQSAVSSRRSSTPTLAKQITFLLTLFGLFSYAFVNLVSFRIVMGVLAVLMILPGLLLYAVDGCRPADYEEKDNVTTWKVKPYGFLLLCLVAGSLYGLGISIVLRAFMLAVGASMFLPGLYLYVVEGCRPEDFREEEKLSPKKVAIFLSSLVSVCLASLYGISISVAFRFFMGVVATLMLLPGLYLYIADGCRPEDDEENMDESQKKGRAFVLFLLGSLGLGGFSGVCLSTFFYVFMGAVAALMLLPGFYLYVVDGCRPEDYTEEDTMNEKSWVVAMSIGLVALYGMRISMVFCVLMGSVAAFMVLPGLYLYMVDGCRPEDVEEEGFPSEKENELSILFFLSLGLGFVYGVCVSTVFRVSVGVVAALMLFPGLYLYGVDGCRPEDYEEEGHEGHNQGNAALPVFVSLGLLSFSGVYMSTYCYVFLGAIATLMLLPGLYLYVVDGCRPEDFEEEENVNKAWDTSFRLSLACLALGCFYGLRSFTIFLACSGFVGVLMLLPGFYLWVVDGCRPEDYVEEDAGDQKTCATVVVFLLGLVLSSLYGMWSSTVFRAIMGVVGFTMLLPGLYPFSGGWLQA